MLINQKIEIVIGTKAQLVKMAPIMLTLDKMNIRYLFTLTGQHENTIDQLVSSFGLKKPDNQLIPNRETDNPIKLFKWFYLILKTILLTKNKNNVHIVLVHGDTLSTLIGAIYAKKIGAKLGHVEAGLRSFNLTNPFPEEIIRILVSRLTDYHYAPGNWAVSNLIKYKTEKINTVLNSIIDSINIATKSNSPSSDQKKKYGVASIHRFENLNKRKRLCFIIDSIIKHSRDIEIIFVLHPVTKEKLIKTKLFRKLQEAPGISLIDRMSYIEFSKLLVNARFLITDGGSNQEEAFYMGLPCLLMRAATERTEGIDNGVVLSEFNQNKVDQFLQHYKSRTWKLKPIPEISPSDIICNHLSTKIQMTKK
ncbi:UDP-N-acetylglucosamine 2-epimerase [Saccharospirillum sp. MSK14-1]|uniref:non-hydrolyzing UDP-N-acetylglucosamine 2-epimerase n=1 Tax=Saccharospirillum sp. MSK14-1 TaxID=1897632 RepID=UPI000D3764ED|nr:UDP-N-acetylglucosamine 2-epimerase (non-hydrolyzing) [Saccharospirillum sp. MSK14-1]PTY38375.1 UDP-N-acetylglucosamine 2-epimerase [Saccharospirillum sp. MSK14-1]